MITNGFAAVGTTVKTGEARILTQETEEGGSDGPLIEVPDVGVMALMAQAWVYFKGRWKTLVGIYLLFYVPMFLVGGVIGLMVVMLVAPVYTGQSIMPQVTNSIYLFLGVMILILVGVVLSFVGQLAMYFGISKKYQGIGVIGAYKKAWGKLGAWWWMMMLAGMAVYGGILLFVIPGILASMYFMMVAFVLVDEDWGGMSGLTKSKFYMKENILFVMGRMIVVSLVLMVVYGAVQFIGGLVGYMVGSGNGDLLAGLGGIIVSVVATPYVLSVQYLLFQAVKARKRGETYDSGQGKGAIVGLILWGMVATALMAAVIFSVGMRSIRMLRESGSGNMNPYRFELEEGLPIEEGVSVEELRVD